MLPAASLLLRYLAVSVERGEKKKKFACWLSHAIFRTGQRFRRVCECWEAEPRRRPVRPQWREQPELYLTASSLPTLTALKKSSSGESEARECSLFLKHACSNRDNVKAFVLETRGIEWAKQ
jgi:hypothetical protein